MTNRMTIQNATMEPIVHLKTLISADTWSALEQMATDEHPEDPARQLRNRINFRKYCNMILDLRQKYAEDRVFTAMVDHYFTWDALKEIGSLGVGYYRRADYQPRSATLFSSSNYSVDAYNLQYLDYAKHFFGIIEECIDQINGSGELQSFSESFEVVLMKYMYLDKHNKAHLYIVKNAPINCVMDMGGTRQQDYLQLSAQKSVPIMNFCIGFTQKEIRDQNWYDTFFIQGSAKASGSGDQNSVGSRVSPVKDQEVIARYRSFSEWTPNLSGLEDGQGVHIEFDLCEYLYLIYAYYTKNQNIDTYQRTIKEILNCLQTYKYEHAGSVGANDNDALIDLCDRASREMEIKKEDEAALCTMQKKVDFALKQVDDTKHCDIENPYNRKDQNEYLNNTIFRYKKLCQG